MNELSNHVHIVHVGNPLTLEGLGETGGRGEYKLVYWEGVSVYYGDEVERVYLDCTKLGLLGHFSPVQLYY